MALNHNAAADFPALLAWDGTKSYPADIRPATSFGFTFEATDDISTDAVFAIEAAPVSAADNCTYGDFSAVRKSDGCSPDNGTAETVTVRAGTKKGAICTGSISYKPDAFIRLTSSSGDTAKIIATITVGGVNK